MCPEIIVGMFISYLLGSLPTGYIVGRMKGINIQSHGSGNIGATNVIRTLGTVPGLLVLIFDISKGFIATYFVANYAIEGLQITSPSGQDTIRIIFGAVAIAGHIWTIFLSFTGGKGVATAAGVVFGMDWTFILIVLAIFVLVVLFTRYVSLGSLVATSSAVILSIILGKSIFFICFAGVVLISTILRHKENISRLKLGTESKFSFSRKK